MGTMIELVDVEERPSCMTVDVDVLVTDRKHRKSLVNGHQTSIGIIENPQPFSHSKLAMNQAPKWFFP